MLSDNFSQVFGVVIDGQSLVSRDQDVRSDFRQQLELLIAGVVAQNGLLDRFGFSVTVLTSTGDEKEYDRIVGEVENILKATVSKEHAPRTYIVDSQEFLNGQLKSELARFANKAPFVVMEGKL